MHVGICEPLSSMRTGGWLLSAPVQATLRRAVRGNTGDSMSSPMPGLPSPGSSTASPALSAGQLPRASSASSMWAAAGASNLAGTPHFDAAAYAAPSSDARASLSEQQCSMEPHAQRRVSQRCS